MARLFYRQYSPAFWNPNALEGPTRGMTLRKWEVSVILCSLPSGIRKALLAWLIAPTDPRWPAPSGAGACGCWAPALSASPRAPAPDSFSRHLLPFTESDLRQPARPLPALLLAEIKAMLQTLDMSLEALHGITRDLLLVAHGTRLRQVVGALGEERALREIEAMQHPARQEQPRPAAYPGKRWARYFAEAVPGV